MEMSTRLIHLPTTIISIMLSTITLLEIREDGIFHQEMNLENSIILRLIMGMMNCNLTPKPIIIVPQIPIMSI